MFRKQLLIAAAIALVATAAFPKSDSMSLIPADAVSVGVVHLSEMRTSPISSMLFHHTDDMTSNGEADQFLRDAGLDLGKDVDLVVVAMSPKTQLGHEADVVILAEGRFNVDRLTKALLDRGAQKKDGYLLLPAHEGKEAADHKGAVAFPNGQLAIVGTDTAVAKALATRASGGSNFNMSLLGQEMPRLDAHATAWALIDVTRATRLTGAPHVPAKGEQHQAVTAAIRSLSTVGMWATDTGDSLKLGAWGVSHDAETLQLLEDTVRGVLSAMRLAVKDSQPDLVPILRKFEVSRSADAVSITGTLPGDQLRKMMAKKHGVATTGK